jgi:hypothetical protein
MHVCVCVHLSISHTEQNARQATTTSFHRTKKVTRLTKEYLILIVEDLRGWSYRAALIKEDNADIANTTAMDMVGRLIYVLHQVTDAELPATLVKCWDGRFKSMMMGRISDPGMQTAQTERSWLTIQNLERLFELL